MAPKSANTAGCYCDRLIQLHCVQGEKLDGKLTIGRFLEFQTKLQSEILALEFERKGPNDATGRISERQFAELLLTYADYSSKKRSAVLKRVKKAYRKTEEKVAANVTSIAFVVMEPKKGRLFFVARPHPEIGMPVTFLLWC